MKAFTLIELLVVVAIIAGHVQRQATEATPEAGCAAAASALHGADVIVVVATLGLGLLVRHAQREHRLLERHGLLAVASGRAQE